METRPVPCFHSAIEPRLIKLVDKSSTYATAPGTFDTACEEEVAGMIVKTCQRYNVWFPLPRRTRVMGDWAFDSLIAKNLLIEKKVEGGWTYELTQFAVEQLYIRQMQREVIELQVRYLEEQRMSPFRLIALVASSAQFRR